MTRPDRARSTSWPPELRFTAADIDAAADTWGLNCGPATLCAVLGLTPDQVRPHLGDFAQKCHTNPSLMFAALRSLGVACRSTIDPMGDSRIDFPHFGIARIQWGGAWTKPGVPIAVRYRHTHWVGVWTHRSGSRTQFSRAIFDVNACESWITFEGWRDKLVPALLHGLPRASGEWWVTHALEIQP